MLLRMGDIQQAEAFSNEQLIAESSHVHRALARYHIYAGLNLNAARSHLRRAISLNKNEPAWVYYYAGYPYQHYNKMYDGLLYTAIPKNASTSLKSFVLDQLLDVKKVNPHSVFDKPYFRSLHYTKKEIQNSTKVLILRNPISRIISFHGKNIVEDGSLGKEYGLAKDVDSFMGLKLTPSFEEFLENLWSYCLVFNDVMHHVLPQAAYFYNLREYDYVCDISEVDGMVKFVADRYNIPNVDLAPREMVPKKKNANEIPEGQERFLRLIYADDYLKISNSTIDLSVGIQKYACEPTWNNFSVKNRLANA